MIYNIKSLIDNRIQAIDGEIGELDDIYFDDISWVVRYLVVETGNWLEGRKVLLSPVVIKKPNVSDKFVVVSLTKDQIIYSPEIDTKKPVSRQHESNLPNQWPIYGLIPLASPYILNEETIQNKTDPMNSSNDPHLRSADEVMEYEISALDGDIGYVEDMIIDEDTWSILFLVVKTKNWLPGKKVLISPKNINYISWEDDKVYVDMTVDSIKNNPEYDSSKPIHQQYAEELNHFFGQTINR